MRTDKVSIEVFQQDWVPGFAAFHDDGQINETAKAHVIINIGSLLAAVQEGDLGAKDLPYMIAESLMHEVVHVLEAWAGVEFSEDRVEELLAKYREKYSQKTVWEYTGKEPETIREDSQP
jgi:ketopantoate reductase